MSVDNGHENAIEGKPTPPADHLLSLGDIASRHLTARTSQTDVLTRSIEEIAQEAANEAELQTLFEGITRPYTELFNTHAQQQPKRAPKHYSPHHGRLVIGGWTLNETTDNGRLTSNVVYGFKRTKYGPDMKFAEVKISSLHDAVAQLKINFFDDNTISSLRLGWEAWEQPAQPHSLLKKIEGTELGEVIDTLIGPLALNRSRGAQSLNFTLGKYPTVTASRDCRFYPDDEDKEGEWRLKTNSDLQYHPGRNLFLRQHGLRDISDTDNLTALNPEEAAVLLHQLLSLVPTISFD